MKQYNENLRQVSFLVVIIALAALLFAELFAFFPGFLGALTLYLLGRNWFIYLTKTKKWKKSLTAVLFITAFLVCIVAPVYFSLQSLYVKIEGVIQEPTRIYDALKAVSVQIKEWTGQDLPSDEIVKYIQQKLPSVISSILNSSFNMLANLIMMLFLAFFMFTNGSALEKSLLQNFPLRKENVKILTEETNLMVKANALGIPVMSAIQGVVALIGYWIFGVKDFVVLGFITGLFSFFPVLGTMVIWIPIVIYLFASGENGKATGLALYSLVITGNVDYLARITLLQRVGHVHPIITVLGLIAGLKLFGFWGFIFGPLLVSYLLLFIKIYRSEFISHKPLT